MEGERERGGGGERGVEREREREVLAKKTSAQKVRPGREARGHKCDTLIAVDRDHAAKSCQTPGPGKPLA